MIQGFEEKESFFQIIILKMNETIQNVHQKRVNKIFNCTQMKKIK